MFVITCIASHQNFESLPIKVVAYSWQELVTALRCLVPVCNRFGSKESGIVEVIQHMRFNRVYTFYSDTLRARVELTVEQFAGDNSEVLASLQADCEPEFVLGQKFVRNCKSLQVKLKPKGQKLGRANCGLQNYVLFTNSAQLPNNWVKFVRVYPESGVVQSSVTREPLQPFKRSTEAEIKLRNVEAGLKLRRDLS